MTTRYDPSTPTPLASSARAGQRGPSSWSGREGRCAPPPWRPVSPPYLRYYSSHRPTDDHGARPAVLVVFDDDLAATHFLRVAREEMRRTGVNVPLRVSHRGALTKAGPLGRAWRTLEGSEHVSAPQVTEHR